MGAVFYLVFTLASAGSPPLLPSDTPVALGHPILGTWKIAFPEGSCTEIYNFRQDGTRVFTSAEEVGESVYEISAIPSPKGFYKFTDTIVKDNGMKDCGGEVIQVGHKISIFIRIHPNGGMFLMCHDEEQQSCFGLLKRVRDNDS